MAVYPPNIYAALAKQNLGSASLHHTHGLAYVLLVRAEDVYLRDLSQPCFPCQCVHNVLCVLQTSALSSFLDRGPSLVFSRCVGHPLSRADEDSAAGGRPGLAAPRQSTPGFHLFGLVGQAY